MGAFLLGADCAVSAKTYSIGVLCSTTGPYGVVARAMRNGAMLAAEQVNAAGGDGVRLRAVPLNPGGDLAGYVELCARVLAAGIRHVVGCYTSSSRKEVIPLFEKHDGLLWYPSHYEGFESSGHVVYTGAVPNQHLLPLVDYLVRAHGGRAFCVGSNYIWAWENNRVLRERVAAHGGTVLAERYFAVGETDLDRVVEQVLDAAPSFVFSTLIGDGAYHFLRRLRAMATARGLDQPRAVPVASCSLSEPELRAIGPEAWDGHISSSVYFSSIPGARNAAFTAAYARRFPDDPEPSADAEAAYVATRLLAASLRDAGCDDVAAVKAAAPRQRVAAPQGEVWLDPETLHAHLTPRIGRSTADGRFDLLHEAPAPVRPDPYLVRTAPRFVAAGHLRAVS